VKGVHVVWHSSTFNQQPLASTSRIAPPLSNERVPSSDKVKEQQRERETSINDDDHSPQLEDKKGGGGGSGINRVNRK
jgi:hypothetical protein